VGLERMKGMEAMVNMEGIAGMEILKNERNEEME
jgi:hypothetical protein